LLKSKQTFQIAKGGGQPLKKTAIQKQQLLMVNDQ